MKKGWKKLLSFALVLGLVFSLVQPLPISVHAANDYFYFENLSTDFNNPTRVYQNRLEKLTGSFHPSVSTSSITYKVDTLVVKDETQTTFDGRFEIVNTVDGSGTAPIITGNRFEFMNVPLGQGLNRVTINGRTTNGTSVSSYAYVYYSNVPAIYNVRLADETPLEADKPVIVTNRLVHIMLEAPNARTVLVNEQAAYSVNGETFIVTNLPMDIGLNTLTIVAYNDTMTYSVTRQIVYLNPDGPPVLYGVEVFNNNGNPKVTSLDGMPTVGQNEGNELKGILRGTILYKYQANRPDPTSINITISGNNGTSDINLTATSVTEAVYSASGGYIGYKFETSSSQTLSISQNGRYTLTAESSYSNTLASLIFNFRNANSPYITEVLEAYGATVTGGNVSYTSSIAFQSNKRLMELPIWIVARGENISGNPWELQVWRNSEQLNLPTGSIESYAVQGDAKARAFKINSLPAGELEFRVVVKDGSAVSDERSFAVTYVPAPFIDITNMHDGKVFKYNQANGGPDAFSNVKGRVVNFTNEELQTLKITINGSQYNLHPNHIDVNNRTFDFPALANPYNIELAPGANTISVSGVASGVPVSRTITVYYLTDDVPVIHSLYPVPAPDILLPGQTRPTADPDGKFRLVGSEYITTEKKADVLLTVENVDKVVLSVDGLQKGAVSWTGANYTVDPGSQLNITVTPVNPSVTPNRYLVRIVDFALPESGTTSIVVTATKGSGTASQVLTIRRERSPYVLLSPKLPEERVINQNFVNIIIQAEGADRIVIDKVEVRGDANDIFRYEKKDLKKGVNKIKFSVFRGEEKIDGEFEVNYVEQIVPGAQYKTTVGRNKISLFGGQLQLEFPRNTLLRTPAENPEQGLNVQMRHVELFDSQQMLFGIANKQDGRTITRYNDDGELVTIYPSATGYLRAPNHFKYASNLFWTDAGYFDQTSSQYTTVPGMHPYEDGNQFFFRYVASSDRYLETTNRGTITIKYDDSIVNAVANRLGIWKWHDFKWVPLGGTVNTKNKTVSAPFEGFGYYAVFLLSDTYNDIAGHDFAREELNLMLARGVMKGKNEVEFGAYDHITRGEFATMLVKILDIPLNYDPNNLTFDDVPAVRNDNLLYDYRYIETAARAGIVDGRQPRIFMPSGTLTREEAATMMARAMNLKLGEYEKEKPKLDKQFTDAGSIYYYAVPSVSAVVSQKIMQGIPNSQPEGTYRFEPKSNLTRAEAAVMAKRVMEKLKKL